MSSRTIYTIEGMWTGYRSEQRRVHHREHTRDATRVEGVRKIGAIRFDDGTSLVLTVHEGKRGEPKNGYGSLISDCIRHGVKRIADLPREGLSRG